jgi:hypothetical protein
MLRMRRALFYELVKRFRERGPLSDSIHTSMEEQVVVCFFMLSVITRGSKLCTTPLEDPYRLYLAISTKSFMQLGSFGKR